MIQMIKESKLSDKMFIGDLDIIKKLWWWKKGFEKVINDKGWNGYRWFKCEKKTLMGKEMIRGDD